MSINVKMDKKRYEIYTYIIEYYWAMEKKGILPFVTTWMNLEDMMLSEISQRKTNIMWHYSHMQSKMVNS